MRSPNVNLAATPDHDQHGSFFIVPDGPVSPQSHDDGRLVRIELGLDELDGLGEIFEWQLGIDDGLAVGFEVSGRIEVALSRSRQAPGVSRASDSTPLRPLRSIRTQPLPARSGRGR